MRIIQIMLNSACVGHMHAIIMLQYIYVQTVIFRLGYLKIFNVQDMPHVDSPG
jgi:hypothetical protein